MILFCPIDIDLTSFDFTQLDNTNQLKAFNPYWNSSAITENTIIENNFNKILEQLPFTKITTLTYKEQIGIVGEHVDVYPQMIFEEGELSHILSNEPAGYRIVVDGATDSIEIFNGVNWVTAYTPSVPCCYILNSTEAKHRIKVDPDRRIIYVRGFLDSTKHKELLNKSYIKYKDYAITRLL